MKCIIRTLSFLLICALLLSVAQPALAQDETTGPTERSGLRPDAPQYAVHGPHWVGYRPLVMDEGTDMETEIDLWYPALNPDGAEESVEYIFTLNTPDWQPEETSVTYGNALLEAPVDAAGGPYPLVVFSHGFCCNPEWYIPFLEHIASYGFIVIAPEHVESFDWEWSALAPATVDRPPVITRALDFAEEMAADGNLAGLIDMENVAVMGHSYGGYTALAMAGAQMDFDAFRERCAATEIEDPAMYESMCLPLSVSEELLVERVGLDGVPDGLWPSLGDPRVTAIIPFAGDAYMFGEDGLAKITVPMMAIGATADTLTPFEWGSKPAYDYVSSDKKALVVFDGAEHTFMMGLYENMPWLPNTPFDTYAGFDAVWGRPRTLDLTGHFATAFLLDTLKGDADAAAALALEAVSFPGIEYQAEGYGDEMAALSPDTIAQIEELVAQQMADNDIPGVSVGIVANGEIAYDKGFGVAERGTDQPMTPQSQFAVACVTKGFTTAAIMQLVDQGLIDLNAPVTDYLPYFKLGDDRYKEITIHHLLANTAGLPMPDYVALNGGFSENPSWRPGLIEEYVRSLADKPMAADPADNQFIYGGDYFDILGDVIAKVTGQPFEEYMTEQFLEPLGLEHTTFIVDELDPELASAAHWTDANGELQMSTPSPTYYPAQTPSNGMFSTTEDLLKWAIFNLNRGEYEGQQIVPATAWDEMWKPQTEIPWGGMYQGWGYGWGVSIIDGHELAYWGGGHIGSPNAYYLMPKENMAVHVFANRSAEAVKGNELPDAIAYAIVEMLLGVESESPDWAAAPALDPELVAAIDAHIQQRIQELNLPGLALGIVQDGQAAYTHGYGVADIDSQEAVTPQTIFQVAEVTFAPTAIAALQLAQASKLDLDAPITNYLPYFQMQGDGWDRITMRQLLQHTSGIPDSGDTAADWTEMNIETDDDAVERFVRGLSDVALSYPPGEGYEWSDIAYDVAGAVIAAVSGQSYEDYMQENVLDPLGMVDSSWLLGKLDPVLLASPHVDGDLGAVQVAEVRPYSRQFAGANNLHSNADDMTKFMLAIMNAGGSDAAPLLPAETMTEMWTDTRETDLGGFIMGNLTPTDMFPMTGTGFVVTEVAGHPVVHAYGGERGFQGEMMFCPDLGVGVVVMGNGTAGGAVYTPEIAVDVLGMLIEQ